jgi:hypothetical protein
MVTFCSLPAPRSLAKTLGLPLASLSKVTSICGARVLWRCGGHCLEYCSILDGPARSGRRPGVWLGGLGMARFGGCAWAAWGSRQRPRKRVRRSTETRPFPDSSSRHDRRGPGIGALWSAVRARAGAGGAPWIAGVDAVVQ